MQPYHIDRRDCLSYRNAMRLMDYASFGALCGLSETSIRSAAKPGEPLFPVVISNKIDVDDPIAIGFIESHLENHIRAAKIEQYNAERTPEQIRREELDALAEDIRALADMSLAELVFHFGSDERFLAWLKSIDQIEKIEGRRIRNCVANGELVKRELVHVGIFMPLDAAFRGLLSDGAKNISTKVAAMVKAGCEQVETEAYVAEVLGSYLDTARAKMQRCLSSLK